MTTYTFPSGRFQGTLNNAATTVFDAVTSDPFFLSDWDTYRSSGETSTSSTLAYPLRIDAAAPGFVFNGGRFYGNIDADIDWDNFYEGGRLTLPSTFPRFNSALIFPRNGVSGTFNDPVFGIRDDLNSGYVDGMRLNQAGNITINRPRVWLGRDDFVECDTVNGKTVTINDGFFENQFLWLSGTGNIPNTFFFVNRSLVHFGRWLFRGNLSYGAPLKVDGASSSPKFRFNDVCLVIGTDDYTSKDRTKAALANTQATNGCRLLVLGGRHVDRELIQLYQNAGFSVLEDGTGDSATVEWQNRKAAFLNEGGPVTPPATPTLASPTTFSVTVGAGPTLVQPVILDVVISGMNSSVGSFSANYPAHDAGDLILVATANDYNVGFLGTMNVTAPGGETVTQEQGILGNEIGDNTEQTLAWHSFVANATRGAGNGVVCDATGGVDQYLVAVIRVQKDTFKDTAPRMGSITKTQENTTATASATAAISAAQEKSTVIAAFNYAFNPPTGGAPTGWTEQALTDIGALVLQIVSRNAATTAAENVAAQTISGNTNANWIGLTGLILPKGA